MRFRTYIVAIVSLIAAAAPLAAQATFNASVRLRAESWDWWNTPTRSGAYTFGAALARASLSNQGKKFGWRVEMAAPVLWGLPENAVTPAPTGQLGLGPAYWAANDSSSNIAGLFLKQAFVRFGRAAGKGGAAVKLGRFEFIDGTETTPANPTLAALKRDRIAHRLIGNFSFSHVQRSVDGLHFTYDRPKLNVTALQFYPTQGVFDVDGWRNLATPVEYVALGGSLSSKKSASDWRVFAIRYDDLRDLAGKVDNRPAAVRAADHKDITIYTFGGHYVQTFMRGSAPVDVLLWGALQTGTWGLLDHSANAFAIEAGVQPKLQWKPWLRVGVDQSSGDKSATDSKHETFFQMLPTPRIYARFPFYNMMNTRDVFTTLILRPTPKATVRADVHDLGLTESTDLWYSGGGAFEPNSFGFAGRPSTGHDDLARLIDVSLEVRPNTHLTATGYLGFAHGRGVIRSIYQNDNARLGYLELEWRH